VPESFTAKDANAPRKREASPPRTRIREGRKKLYREENDEGQDLNLKVAKEPRQSWHTGNTSANNYQRNTAQHGRVRFGNRHANSVSYSDFGAVPWRP
jgi:hypothetical protein